MQSDTFYQRNYFTWGVGIRLLYLINIVCIQICPSNHLGEIAYFVSSFLKGSIKSVQKVTYYITPYECVKSLTIKAVFS